jgi:N-acetylglucosaminyl-diphospho-decaprenol L-rhamnosyltransferase
VNTDNRELLLACLRSLPAAAGACRLQVVLVDNASRDGSVQAVGSAHPDVEVVARGERHGFGANHNAAIARARGRYVFVLNEDTVLAQGCLERLCAFMDMNPGVGAAGPRIRFPDGSRQPSAWHFPSPARVLLTTLALQRAFWDQSRGERIRRVDWLCGAALLVRRSALADVGGFDERFFVYAEDVDLCRRVRRAGWDVALFPPASLVHYENATTTGVPERRIYQMARSRGLYARLHHGRLGERVVQAATAGAFRARALLARRLPGYGEDAARRFEEHARASLAPYAKPAMEEAARR